MKYIVYMTVNTKSTGLQKIYVGVHKTKDPAIFDGYIGGGCWANVPSTYMYPKTPFRIAVKKYGVDAFKRYTLYIYDTADKAYKKEREIVDGAFVNQPHVYNTDFGGRYDNTLYQFDYDGTLKRVWKYPNEAYEFYGLQRKRFLYAVSNRYGLLNSYWANTDHIDITKYRANNHGTNGMIYLYDINGKYSDEFSSKEELAKYLGIDVKFIEETIKNQRFVLNRFYITNKMVDEFVPKPRAQYLKTEFYVYKDTGEYIGAFIGKKLMPVISLHSWAKISDIMKYRRGWYKNFLLSETKLNKVPEREIARMKVDVYDKYGNYIETLESIRDVKEKYEVPSAKMKDIQKGDKYFKDWIFRYHSVHA